MIDEDKGGFCMGSPFYGFDYDIKRVPFKRLLMSESRDSVVEINWVQFLAGALAV